MPSVIEDVDALIGKLSLDEKVRLLAGQGSFKTTGLPERGIPQIVVSDLSCLNGSLAENPLDVRRPTWHPWRALFRKSK